MGGWKFVAEFRRGRNKPIALECFVAIADLKQAHTIAADRLVGDDEVRAAEIPDAKLRLRNVRDGDAVILLFWGCDDVVN